jgi:hypothetical protein
MRTIPSLCLFFHKEIFFRQWPLKRRTLRNTVWIGFLKSGSRKKKAILCLGCGFRFIEALLFPSLSLDSDGLAESFTSSLTHLHPFAPPLPHYPLFLQLEWEGRTDPPCGPPVQIAGSFPGQIIPEVQHASGQQGTQYLDRSIEAHTCTQHVTAPKSIEGNEVHE